MRIFAAPGVAVIGLLPLLAVAAYADDTEAVKELAGLEERWVHAENIHDTATLRMILDERFIVVSNSKVESRDEFIANVTAGPVDPAQTQTMSDRTFLVDGDTAVVNETDTVRGTRNGQPVSFAMRCTTTYIRRNGRWRALAEVFGKPPARK